MCSTRKSSGDSKSSSPDDFMSSVPLPSLNIIILLFTGIFPMCVLESEKKFVDRGASV